MKTLAATKPTEAQIRKLEAAHKELFFFLVQANKIWLAMSKDYAYLPNTDKRKQVLLNYGKKLITTLVPWQMRQKKYEQAGVPVIDPNAKNYFLNRANEPKLDAIVATMAKPGSLNGLGFIPLLIWAAIALIGAFTATEVVDELNTTAEEKADLMQATTDSCAELNLSTQDCTKILSQTQSEASAEGGITSTIKWGIGGVIAFMLLQQFMKSQNKN